MIKHSFQAAFASVLFFSSLIAPMMAQERNERSFYAISSLRSYLHGMMQNDQSETIHYEDSDLEQLWQIAASDETGNAYVEVARDYFEEKNYAKSEEMLYSVWQDFQNELLNDVNDNHFDLKNSIAERKGYYPNFDNNPYLDAAMRLRILPFLLPLNHPTKPILDIIFSQFRVTETDDTIKYAGFDIIFLQAISYIRVLKHPQLPGYLIKAYPDYEMRIKEGKQGWEWFAMRCDGAVNIQKIIQKKKLKYFIVPSKYIYPLPVEPSPVQYTQTRKPVVLLVSDMKLVGDVKTSQAWKNAKEKHLNELYCILSHGYSSTFIVNNIPYTEYGKFACIDTEHPKRVLDYSKIKQYLSEDMQKYWDKLVKKGGKI